MIICALFQTIGRTTEGVRRTTGRPLSNVPWKLLAHAPVASSFGALEEWTADRNEVDKELLSKFRNRNIKLSMRSKIDILKVKNCQVERAFQEFKLK